MEGALTGRRHRPLPWVRWLIGLALAAGCAVQHQTAHDGGRADGPTEVPDEGLTEREDLGDVIDGSGPVSCVIGTSMPLSPDTVPYSLDSPFTSVVDTRGPVALWSTGTDVHAARPGSASVPSMMAGRTVAAAVGPDGVLVCTWMGDDDETSGQCLRLGLDLQPIGPSWSVPFRRGVRFDRLGDRLFAVSRRVPSLRPPELVVRPIDEDGQPQGEPFPVPCTRAGMARFSPTDDGWVCADEPVCADGSCSTLVRFFGPDGRVDATIPLPDLGASPPNLAIAARGSSALAVWENQGLRALPLSPDRVGTEASIPLLARVSWVRVWPLAGGYFIGTDGPPPDPWRGRFVDSRGRPTGPEVRGGAGDPAQYPIAVEGSGVEWTLFALERHAPSTHRFHAVSLGCPTAECGDGYRSCVDADGRPVCVDLAAERCHCGACGRECEVGCRDGACVDECGPGIACGAAAVCRAWERAPVECVDPLTDLRHCGTCDAPCDSAEVCVEGACCALRENRCGGAVDTDCDGRVGCEDCDCALSGACGFATPGVELSCSNGRSDDADAAIDCEDLDCTDARECGGPGRCAMVDLGSRLPVHHTGLFAVLADSTTASCAPAGTLEHTIRWTAPAAGTYRFRSAFQDVAIFDGSCDGPELGCDASEVAVALRAGQSVVVALEGNGDCAQLDIEHGE